MRFSHFVTKIRPLSVVTRFNSTLARNSNSNLVFTSKFNAKSQLIVGRMFSTSKIFSSKIQAIKPPAFPESISEGDIRWSVDVGSFVKSDDLIGEIETDKTTLPVHSPYSGVITKLMFEDGAKVLSDDVLCELEQGESAEAPSSESSSTVISPKETKQTKVEFTVSKSEEPLVVKKVTTSHEPKAKLEFEQDLLSERIQNKVKMTRIRQTTAQRLKDAQNTCAMLTTFNEVDMSNLMELRKKYQDQFVKKHNIKLGFMSAFLSASSNALQSIPAVNAYVEDNYIVYNNYVDISVAVATSKGLVVPVIKNVHQMNFAQIEKALVDLGDKAKNNKLAIEDMEGGTFTVSNGGIFGSLISTPIINPPQSAILGMHAINERPVAVNGNVVIRPMMYIALTYDHRLVDGKEAVTFLKKIKEAVEDPRALLLGL